MLVLCCFDLPCLFYGLLGTNLRILGVREFVLCVINVIFYVLFHFLF